MWGDDGRGGRVSYSWFGVSCRFLANAWWVLGFCTVWSGVLGMKWGYEHGYECCWVQTGLGW
jgi:hypothetical protein